MHSSWGPLEPLRTRDCSLPGGQGRRVSACPHYEQYAGPPLSGSDRAVNMELVFRLDRRLQWQPQAANTGDLVCAFRASGGESGRKPQYVTPNVLFDMNISELKQL